MAQSYPGVRHIIQQAYLRQDIPNDTVDIIYNSLSKNTLNQYNVAIKQWYIFCQTNNLNCYESSKREVLGFLTEQFKKGASYGTLNSFRSALSLIIGKDICNNDTICRFFKGVFKMKPSFPKYHSTWDPNIVLEFLSKISNESAPLDLLSKKLVTLLALSTGQRVQTISVIDLSSIFYQNTYIAITINDIIKTSMANRRNPILTIPFFGKNESICPAKTLSVYIERTSQFRDLPNTCKLILTVKKPVHNATSQTISRWIKQTLQESGVDVSVFTAHSTRHASTSAASRSGISIDVIKRTAGWTGNSLCFAKFYNQPLLTDQDTSFAESVLSSYE